jgi:molybdopterin biosynthesis enzyme
MAQLPCQGNITVSLKISETVDIAKNATGRFLPVKIEGEKAFPVINDNKGLIDIARADGYIILDEETAALEEGTAISVNLF